MDKRPVYCPLLEKEIDGNTTCFDIAMVAEKDSPARFAPAEAMVKENWREICLDCENHLDN